MRRSLLSLIWPSLVLAQSFEPPSAGFLVDLGFSPSVVADFDGDGDLDALAGTFGYVAVLYRNDGAGRFVGEVIPHLLVQGGYAIAASSFAAADIDGDGDVDVVVGTSGTRGACGATNLILRNDGTGAFAVQPLSSGFENTQHVLANDFDGDGDVDIVCSNFGSAIFCTPQNCTLLRNDGAGSFTNVVLVGTQQRFGAQALDVQGDGLVDIVFAGAPLLVMSNSGNGAFTAMPGALPHTLDSMRSADLDGDGDVDLLGIDGGAVRLLRNDGGGVFTPRNGPAAPNPVQLCVPGDIDGDGDFDLVLSFGPTPSQPTGTKLWRQDPGLTFTDVTAAQLADVSGGAASANFFDAEGDGDLDLQLGGTGLLHNDGSGRLLRLEPWHPRMARNGLAVDLDGDGHTDVVGVLSGNSGPLLWWRNDGTGQFPVADKISASWVGLPVLTLDVDADGDQDVFTGGKRMYRNDGGRAFTDVSAVALPPPVLPPNSMPLSAAVAGDFDLDGDLDIFVAHGAQWPPSPVDWLLLNDGTGNFVVAGPGHFSDPGDTFGAVGLDFDGDGDLDLATANTGGIVRLFANDGTAHFTEVTVTNLPPGPQAGALLPVDIDGDQDPDLVLGGSGPSARLLQNGNGVFVDVTNNLPPIVSSASPQAADFDVDGDADLNFGGQWLVNDGLGNFALGVTATYANYGQPGLFADIDDDGDPDWLAYSLNLHRQLENALPPRLGHHGELRLHARTNLAGWTPLAWLLLAPGPAAAPVPLGPLGSLRLDPASMLVHSLHPVPATPGFATVRYLCPNAPSLLGTPIWSQALFVNGPTQVHWRLGSVVPLTVRL